MYTSHELKRVLFTLLLPARDGFSDFSERVQYTFTVYAKQTKILQISNVCSDIKSMHGTDYLHTSLIKQSELRSDVHLEVVSRRRFAFQTLYDLYIVTFMRHSSCSRVLFSFLISAVQNIKQIYDGICLFTIVVGTFWLVGSGYGLVLCAEDLPVAIRSPTEFL